MNGTVALENRVADLEHALVALLTALDARDQDPRAYVRVDSARALAEATLENARAREPQTMHALAYGLIAEGYRCEAPSPLSAEIDGEAVNGCRCKLCGGFRVYRPFTKNGGERAIGLLSYRAFGHCQGCGDVTEI
jgi:hypothetical protein